MFGTGKREKRGKGSTTAEDGEVGAYRVATGDTDDSNGSDTSVITVTVDDEKVQMKREMALLREQIQELLDFKEKQRADEENGLAVANMIASDQADDPYAARQNAMDDKFQILEEQMSIIIKENNELRTKISLYENADRGGTSGKSTAAVPTIEPPANDLRDECCAIPGAT